MCTSWPLAAVTTTVEVPAGVGVEDGGEVPLPLLPPLPPPHPLPRPEIAQSVRASTVSIRRLEELPSRKIEASPPPVLMTHQSRRRRGSTSCAAAAVVVTVRTALPLPVIEAGEKLQLAPAGRAEQELELKLMVPV